MSIIHNALSKIQRREALAQQPIQINRNQKLRGKKLGKIITIFLFGLGFIFLGTKLPSYFSSLTPTPPPRVVVAHVMHTHNLTLQLKGIFLSEEDKIALINNDMLALGDKIDGLQVASIESNRVLLKDKEHTVVLNLH